VQKTGYTSILVGRRAKTKVVKKGQAQTNFPISGFARLIRFINPRGFLTIDPVK
jgi:hypothetical protein